jgi:hypothetical protein
MLKCILLVICIFLNLINAWNMEHIKMNVEFACGASVCPVCSFICLYVSFSFLLSYVCCRMVPTKFFWQGN